MGHVDRPPLARRGQVEKCRQSCGQGGRENGNPEFADWRLEKLKTMNRLIVYAFGDTPVQMYGKPEFDCPQEWGHGGASPAILPHGAILHVRASARLWPLLD
ncbi:hypothetical protein SAMD00023353_1000330 [Rosellinia necatrix]|uniref:Uncharacterized protein n=1 Tax=Rosellinia necatrix TaxID=77044 RepID=A0A1S8A6D4_ROSNE|nr:hypothetical protein SAMD00023353_1000330 [Rosellinia necatrix]